MLTPHVVETHRLSPHIPLATLPKVTLPGLVVPSPPPVPSLRAAAKL